MLRIPFKWFEFAFEWWNLVGMVQICIQMLRIPFEWLHSNASNLIRMVRVCIQMLWVWFEWLAFAFKCFDSHSNSSNLRSNDGIWLEWFEFGWNGSNLHSNASNPFWMVAFKCFEFDSNAYNLHSNALSFVRMVSICIQMFRFSFK